MGEATNGINAEHNGHSGKTTTVPDTVSSDQLVEENASPEELHAAIEETRAEMSETIDAIQAKLNPQNIKERIAEDARHRVSEIAETAKAKWQEVAAPAVGKGIETAKSKVSEVQHLAGEKIGAMRGETSHSEASEKHLSTHTSTHNARKGPLKPISEQVVVVFGASSGIGRETALQFARKGAKVVIAARNEEGLQSLVEDIRHVGGEAIYQVADVTDFAQVKAVADLAAERFGRLDTWVHCAAVSLYATFEQTTPEEFKRLIEVNLVGQAHGALAALPHLRQEGRGALIHISSVEGKRAFPYPSAYASSKHGVIGLLDALRVELMNEGVPIFVTNVMPAGINTPFFNKARTKLGVKPMPAPPIYQPSVVAEVILHAAEHPTRDIVAGGAAKSLIAMQKLSPALMDKMLMKGGFSGQRTKEPKPENAPDNLYEPISGYNKIGGDFYTKAKAKSLSNWLETHPAAQSALKGAALGLVALLLLRRK